MADSFSAAIVRRLGGPVVIEEVRIEALRRSDVLVKLGASGICHTDLEVLRGELAAPMPIVLGHEGAGIVVAIGSDVTTVSAGDHVVGSWNPSCGTCFYCIRDLPILCERASLAGSRGGLPDGATRLTANGTPIHHFGFIASHAEYAVLHESSAIPIPVGIPLDLACLLGCAVSTGFCAPFRIAKVSMGSCVAIVGCGAVGLNAVQGARVAGAAEIIAVDIDERRLRLAQELGATQTIHGLEQDALAETRRLSQSRGADFVFEAGGSNTTMQLALELARPGGDVVLLGKVPLDSPVSFRFGSLFGEKRIVRSSYGGARPQRDFPILAGYYLSGQLKLSQLITHRLRLSEIGEGFQMVADGAAIRAVVTFS
jgi:S-(hydroxymethyl)glutathione dehydrogenase/alcohol dehydrogenase